jgi:hypothetical protein
MTEDERFQRQLALSHAVSNNGPNGTDAGVIVSDAEEFRRFLAGETPTSEGTK